MPQLTRTNRRDALKSIVGFVTGAVAVEAIAATPTPLPALNLPSYVPPGVYTGGFGAIRFRSCVALKACPQDMKYIALLEELERKGTPIPIHVWGPRDPRQADSNP